MRSRRLRKKNIVEVYAIVEKEIQLYMRFKSYLIISLLNPLIQLVVYFFIFGAIFGVKPELAIGYWTASNYLLFLCIAMCINYFTPIITTYVQSFTLEKYWKTLSAIIIAPVNKMSLLAGILISQIILNGVGLIFLLVIGLIFFPISIFNLLLFLFVFFSILLVFGSMGLILGAFSISNENFKNYYSFFLRFLFLFSCINYPKELFPEFIQFFITLNPLYHLFDFLRIIWFVGVSPAAIIYITPLHIFLFVSITILLPIIAVLLFEKIYRKSGIVGY